jgi:hypothetical protein
MAAKNPLHFFGKSKNLSRKGLSETVVVLILVIVGVSLALLVGSIVGGQLGGWARKEGIIIEDVSAALVGPLGSQQLCVTVQVKNTGGSPVTSITAQTAPVSVPLSGFPASLNPGSSGSASGCAAATGIGRGDMLTIRVSGNIPGGSTSHQRSVPVT